MDITLLKRVSIQSFYTIPSRLFGYTYNHSAYTRGADYFHTTASNASARPNLAHTRSILGTPPCHKTQNFPIHHQAQLGISSHSPPALSCVPASSQPTSIFSSSLTKKSCSSLSAALTSGATLSG